MVIKNTKLGGADFVTPSDRVKPTDLNDTNDAMFNHVSTVLLHSAISNYKILQSNNVFENGDQSFVDEFVDTNGTNNTVNLTTTDAFFVTDHYEINFSNIYPGDGSSNVSGQNGSQSVYTGQVVQRGLAGIPLKGCFLKSFTIFSVCVGSTRFRILDSTLAVVHTTTYSGNGLKTLATPFFLEAGKQYYFAVDDNGGSYSMCRDTSVNAVDSIDMNINGGWDGAPSSEGGNVEFLTTETASLLTVSNVEIDANLYTLDGTEKGILIWAKETNTANTSITYDITDGTTILSGKSGATYIDISSFIAGTLAISANLNGDGTDTPDFFGYSVVIIK